MNINREKMHCVRKHILIYVKNYIKNESNNTFLLTRRENSCNFAPSKG